MTPETWLHIKIAVQGIIMGYLIIAPRDMRPTEPFNTLLMVVNGFTLGMSL